MKFSYHDLKLITQLISYLNQSFNPPESTLAIDGSIRLVDSNGNIVGWIIWESPTNDYVFKPGE